jgi:hypothetical protein
VACGGVPSLCALQVHKPDGPSVGSACGDVEFSRVESLRSSSYGDSGGLSLS